jgi:hypothetical protein
MDYLRELIGTFWPIRTSGSRALLAFSLAIGNHFVAADHGRRSRAQVLRRATAHLLDPAGPTV